MSDEDDDDLGEYDSGPYCSHWHDPSDCEEMCLCGHECRQHFSGAAGCKVCDCEEFVDENPLL